MAMSEPYPYNMPIFRRAHRLASPDGSMVAEIERAHEVSMSNPTIGTLTLSTGLQLDRCNPSFIWSDDSRYLAVPCYFPWLGLFRRQRMVVLDTRERRALASRERAFYFQPESFAAGVLVATREPFHSPTSVAWHIPDSLATFKSMNVTWAPLPVGRSVVNGFRDEFNPTADELRAWALVPAAFAPSQDWELIISSMEEHFDLYLELAESGAPGAETFLRCLRCLVGDEVRSPGSTCPRARVELLVDRGARSLDPRVRQWAKSAQQVLEHPESFRYDDWF
jgi:hypothetical protein